MTRSAILFLFAGSVPSDFKGRVSTQREYSELSTLVTKRRRSLNNQELVSVRPRTFISIVRILSMNSIDSSWTGVPKDKLEINILNWSRGKFLGTVAETA